MEPVSELSFIEVKDPKNPLSLFKEWLDEMEEYGTVKARVLNLATSSRNGDVSNRTVVLRELMDDFGLGICTPVEGQKHKDMSENPKVACCFLWMYVKGDKRIHRQVRIQGLAEKAPPSKAKTYYDPEPLYCKIRAHICDQNKKTDWNELKLKHDQLLKDVLENGKVLEMPDNYLAYKIIPKRVDFYSAWNSSIADRILFTKAEETDSWNFDRIGT